MAGARSEAPARSVLDLFSNPCVMELPRDEIGASSAIQSSFDQLTALVAASCCFHPTGYQRGSAHVLVTTDGNLRISPSRTGAPDDHVMGFLRKLQESLPASIRVSSTPLRLSENTTREEVSSMLYRADSSSSLQAVKRQQQQQQQQGAGSAVSLSRLKGHTRDPSTLSSDGNEHSDDEGMGQPTASTLSSRALPGMGGGAPHHHRHHHHSSVQVPTVVLVMGIERAQGSALAALQDVLVHGHVGLPHAGSAAIGTGGMTVKRVPRIRLLAVCDEGSLQMLPTSLRAGFLVSMYLPQALMLRYGAGETSTPIAVGIGGTSAFSSAGRTDAVDHAVVDDLLRHTTSIKDENTVNCHAACARYMRQLAVAVRGSALPFTSVGVHFASKTTSMLDLCKVMALLTMRSRAITTASGRVLVTPTVVSSLMPHFLTHLIQMRPVLPQPGREWLFGGSAGSLNSSLTLSRQSSLLGRVPSLTLSRNHLSVMASAGFGPSRGLGDAAWDAMAVAASSDRPVVSGSCAAADEAPMEVPYTIAWWSVIDTIRERAPAPPE